MAAHANALATLDIPENDADRLTCESGRQFRRLSNVLADTKGKKDSARLRQRQHWAEPAAHVLLIESLEL